MNQVYLIFSFCAEMKWFVERKKDYSSILYSLDNFKVRYDKKIEKD